MHKKCLLVCLLILLSSAVLLYAGCSNSPSQTYSTRCDVNCKEALGKERGPGTTKYSQYPQYQQKPRSSKENFLDTYTMEIPVMEDPLEVSGVPMESPYYGPTSDEFSNSYSSNVWSGVGGGM